MSTTTLSAASSDRKARLAQLKSLKRKEPPSDTPLDAPEDDSSPRPAKSPRTSPSPEPTPNPHLSGRNFDPLTRGPKLGFSLAPTALSNTTTLESRASALAAESKAAQEAEKAAQASGQDAPLDLFKLQPKKPNWDLKRELERRMQPLEVRMENAIARLVRERVEGQKKAAVAKGEAVGGDGEGQEEVGMEGNVLVEATKEREREEVEERGRERELEAELEAP
ncbi:cwf18 pre-mRNA splicing factor-domain-containing protein [Elsinoe ampelina]|uniref:Cwf18 pre-mRNA splicing factor-domain-containing protein n=1 Tax=Elsinoe ampelina TaxID=302913 RepID=A0A6A6GCB3_9PEZI|nr:cwf18 pre-mRNA splicing factor-domain-containing protein [Elsinoe ampelina]